MKILLVFLVVAAVVLIDVGADDVECVYAKFVLGVEGYGCRISSIAKKSGTNTIHGDHEPNQNDANVKSIQHQTSSLDPKKINKLDSSFCKKFPNLEGILWKNIVTDSVDEDAFKFCKNLQTVYLWSCELKKIPDNLFPAEIKLKNIIYRDNKIKDISENLFTHQTGLVDLDLSYNGLSTLPPKIFETLTNLKVLDIGFNSITTLNPEWFKNLGKLEHLILNTNKLVDLPIGIFAKLSNLKELEMENTHLKFVHADSFGAHPQLTKIIFHYNDLEGIDPKFIDNYPSISSISLAQGDCYPNTVNKPDIKKNLKPCFDKYRPRA